MFVCARATGSKLLLHRERWWQSQGLLVVLSPQLQPAPSTLGQNFQGVCPKWMLGLLLPFGCCEWCCHEHACASSSLRPWLQFFYLFFCQISKTYVFFVCHRILVISLCVPWDEKVGNCRSICTQPFVFIWKWNLGIPMKIWLLILPLDKNLLQAYCVHQALGFSSEQNIAVLMDPVV